MQGRKRDSDIENRLMDTAGEGEYGTERSTEIYILPYVKQIVNVKSLCDKLDGEKVGGRLKREGTYVHL